MAPQGLGSLLARGAGGLTDRIGPRPVVLGGVILTALGTLPFALAGRHPGGLLLGTALVVRGAGLSAANMAVMVGAFNGLGRDHIPHASSMTRIMQQVGGSFGPAVLAVLLQRRLAGHPGAAGQATAFGHTFAWAAAFSILAVVPALLPWARGRPRRGAPALLSVTPSPRLTAGVSGEVDDHNPEPRGPATALTRIVPAR